MSLPLLRFPSVREGPAAAQPCEIRAFARATVRALGRDFGLGDPVSRTVSSTKGAERSAEPAPDSVSESHTRERSDRRVRPTATPCWAALHDGRSCGLV